MGLPLAAPSQHLLEQQLDAVLITPNRLGMGPRISEGVNQKRFSFRALWSFA